MRTGQDEALAGLRAGEDWGGWEESPHGPGPLPGLIARARSLRLHHVAAAWGTGAALHAAGLGTGLDALAAGGGTALCTAAAAAGAWGRLSTWGRVHAATAAAYATGWASWSAVHGPGGHVNAAALLGAGALVLPWWLKRAPGWLDHEVPDDPFPEWEDRTAARIRDMLGIWDAYVACEGGPLPGTRLEDPQESADAVSADIVLRRGRQVTTEALRKWEHVASAYEEDETRVIMEPHPGRKKNRARLTLFDRDVLADRHEWSGSTLDMATGIARAGTFYDGRPMRTRFFVPGSGAAHMIIAGTTGSGKSTGIFGLIAETTDPGNPVPVVNVLIDPEEGAQSMPLWARKLKHAYLGPDKAMRALRGLDALVDQRALEMSEEGLDFFEPTRERPLVDVTIEESRVLLKEHPRKQEAKEIIERLVARGRKKGVRVKLAALVPSLEELDSQLIRSMLRAFDVWCFRTGDSVTNGMLGLQVDPSLLPEAFADGSPTYGLCYLKGVDGRQAVGRSLDIPKERKAGIVERAVECPLDASSEAAFERGYNPPKAAPAPAPPAAAAAPAQAPADLQQAVQVRGAASQAILAFLGLAAADQSKAQILVGLRPAGITSPSTVQYALRQLADQGLICTAGDKHPYRITEAGREWLARNSQAA
jgi:FtsK/SpoIIIE family